MFTSLILCVAAGWRLGLFPPPQPNQQFERAIERMHREQLELNKSRRAGLEEMIKWYERKLTDPLTARPALDNHMLLFLRAKVQSMKNEQIILEWWEQQRKLNPGSKTDQEAIDKLDKLSHQWQTWRDAWEHGKFAPPPRVKK